MREKYFPKRKYWEIPFASVGKKKSAFPSASVGLSRLQAQTVRGLWTALSLAPTDPSRAPPSNTTPPSPGAALSPSRDPSSGRAGGRCPHSGRVENLGCLRNSVAMAKCQSEQNKLLLKHILL